MASSNVDELISSHLDDKIGEKVKNLLIMKISSIFQ